MRIESHALGRQHRLQTPRLIGKARQAVICHKRWLISWLLAASMHGISRTLHSMYTSMATALSGRSGMRFLRVYIFLYFYDYTNK